MKITPDGTTKIEFCIDTNALIETPTRKISDITFVIEYENPQAYGYPEVCRWETEYEFDRFTIDELRRIVNGED